MDIAIRYGKALEMQRVRMTLAKIKWIKARGYKINLPSGIKDNDGSDEIRTAVEREYQSSIYEQTAARLLAEFETLQMSWVPKMKKVFGPQATKSIEVILTRYGTGGAFFQPNTVMLNIAYSQSGAPLISTLKTMIINLLSEPIVQQKQFGPDQREKFIKDVEKRIDALQL